MKDDREGEPRIGETGKPERAAAAFAAALAEHGPLLAKVCMALVGDADRATRALEQVAREGASKPVPEGGSLVFLLGLARGACALQSSRAPLQLEADAAPRTERMHGVDAARARGELGKLRPTEREAVVLRLVGGLDVEAIAAVCGVDREAAEARLARGLAQLVEFSGKVEGGGA